MGWGRVQWNMVFSLVGALGNDIRSEQNEPVAEI